MEHLEYVYRNVTELMYSGSEKVFSYFVCQTNDQHFAARASNQQPISKKSFSVPFRFHRKNFWTMEHTSVIRFAGFSGAFAVLFAAYGAHKGMWIGMNILILFQNFNHKI
jgi:hypothetical protein